jgi:hypothetical protein
MVSHPTAAPVATTTTLNVDVVLERIRAACDHTFGAAAARALAVRAVTAGCWLLNRRL